MLLSDLFENGVGRITKQNQTVDVGPDELVIQAKKFGNSVTRDGYPPLLRSRVKKVPTSPDGGRK